MTGLITHQPGQTNKHRYVLAAQSVKLRTSLSTIPGLPMIHFNPRGVLVQSPPSRATLKQKDSQEEERRVEGATALQGIVDGDNVFGGAAVNADPSSSFATTAYRGQYLPDGTE